MLEILAEIEADLLTVSPDEIARTQRSLEPPEGNEKILGTIYDQQTRELYALGHRYIGMAMLAIHRAHFVATTHEEAEEAKSRHERFKALGEFVKQLFWVQAKQVIGGSAWTATTIGIRAGWVLTAQDADARGGLLKKLGLPPEIFGAGGEG